MINDGRIDNEEIRYNVTSDTTFYGIIPRGYILERVIIQNITANAGQLSLGITSTTGEYFATETINASGNTVINTGMTPVSPADTTLYLNDSGSGDTWNSMTLNIRFVFKKIGI